LARAGGKIGKRISPIRTVAACANFPWCALPSQDPLWLRHQHCFPDCVECQVRGRLAHCGSFPNESEERAHAGPADVSTRNLRISCL